jgi:hypothetical protein
LEAIIEREGGALVSEELLIEGVALSLVKAERVAVSKVDVARSLQNITIF